MAMVMAMVDGREVMMVGIQKQRLPADSKITIDVAGKCFASAHLNPYFASTRHQEGRLGVPKLRISGASPRNDGPTALPTVQPENGAKFARRTRDMKRVDGSKEPHT